MKFMTLISFMLASTLTLADVADFPSGPEISLTPGSLCSRPSEYRYPENIAYCRRDVSSSLKRDIFEKYREVGFRLDPSQRAAFKIDHYIPLCAGGSNQMTNLWPQHSSIYKVTDPLESFGCEKLKAGKISQKELVDLFKLVKNDLSRAGTTLKYLQSL